MRAKQRFLFFLTFVPFWQSSSPRWGFLECVNECVTRSHLPCSRCDCWGAAAACMAPASLRPHLFGAVLSCRVEGEAA
eukprot:360508-Chlamydomonas_euryale.AAC.2